MSDIAAEAAAWLEQRIPDEIARIRELAALSQRRPNGGNSILVLTTTCAHPINQAVADVTPEQLRDIAAKHREDAELLWSNALELLHYAKALEEPTPTGAAIIEHLGVMRAEADHKRESSDAAYETARGPGGVLQWTAIADVARRRLMYAGILTIDDVRDAIRAGTLRDVNGIGPARLQEIMAALASMPSGEATA